MDVCLAQLSSEALPSLAGENKFEDSKPDIRQRMRDIEIHSHKHDNVIYLMSFRSKQIDAGVNDLGVKKSCRRGGGKSARVRGYVGLHENV